MTYTYKLNQPIQVTLFRHLNANAQNAFPATITGRKTVRGKETYQVTITSYGRTKMQMNYPRIIDGITKEELDPIKEN